MATIDEAASQSGSSDKAAGLIAAISLLSGEQTYAFELYKRVVLPLDGFVFWIKSSQLENYIGRKDVGAMYRSSPFGRLAFDSLARQVTLTPQQKQKYTFSINGSLHVSQQMNQDSDTTYVAQDISFTTKTQVTYFESIAPDEIYILTIPNVGRVAFGNQRNRYSLAGIWHYHGKAVFSTMASQIIDNEKRMNPNNLIVSNSLPYWLALSTADIPVYPSYLSPKNLSPPYITADVQITDAIQSWPLVDEYSSQGQLVSDTIEFTMYGLNNQAALDFQMSVLNGSEYGEYGIQNVPVPMDMKANQTEFQVIAQKKVMRLQVSYYQYQLREYARRLIEIVQMAATVGGGGGGASNSFVISYPPPPPPQPPVVTGKYILEQTFVYDPTYPANIQFNSVMVDGLGNIYPSGAYTPDWPSGVYLAKAKFPDTPISWERSFGFGQNLNSYYPRQVGMDNMGMIYTVGNISNGGGTANNYSRPMVQKWDTDGNLIFQKKLQYTENRDGYFYQTIPDPIVYTYVYYIGVYSTSQGLQLFIVKVDSSQNVVWANYYQTGNAEQSNYSNLTNCVALDSSGNICAVTEARYNDGARIGGIYLIKISPDGSLLSTNQYVLPDEGVIDTQDIDANTAIDQYDNVYSVINYFHVADDYTSKYITYVVKISPSGEMLWQNKIHQNIQNESLYGSSIDIDNFGNVIICGNYGIQGETSTGTGLIVKFSPTGQILLSKDIDFSVPATSNQYVWLTSVGINDPAEIVVTGNYGNNENVQTTAFVGKFDDTTPNFSAIDSLGKTISYQNSNIPIYTNVNDFTEVTVIPEPLVVSKTCSFVDTDYAIAGYSGDRTIQFVPN